MIRNMPDEINGAVIGGFAILVVVIVGIVVFGSFTGVTVKPEVDYFTVYDPNVDRDCVLDYLPQDAYLSVDYYDGSSWKTLTTAQYSRTGYTVTVLAAAMD